MTAGNCNMEGLPVRATARLDNLVGGSINVIKAGSLGKVSLGTGHLGLAAVGVIWAVAGFANHRSLDNIVIYRH